MPLNLPERASYEYLKKLAKDRLAFNARAQSETSTRCATCYKRIRRSRGNASLEGPPDYIAPCVTRRRCGC